MIDGNATPRRDDFPPFAGGDLTPLDLFNIPIARPECF